MGAYGSGKTVASRPWARGPRGHKAGEWVTGREEEVDGCGLAVRSPACEAGRRFRGEGREGRGSHRCAKRHRL